MCYVTVGLRKRRLVLKFYVKLVSIVINGLVRFEEAPASNIALGDI
jgi:hypothetical protein